MNPHNAPRFVVRSPPTLHQMVEELCRAINAHSRMFVDTHNKNLALQADVNRLTLEVNALRVRLENPQQ